VQDADAGAADTKVVRSPWLRPAGSQVRSGKRGGGCRGMPSSPPSRELAGDLRGSAPLSSGMCASGACGRYVGNCVLSRGRARAGRQVYGSWSPCGGLRRSSQVAEVLPIWLRASAFVCVARVLPGGVSPHALVSCRCRGSVLGQPGPGHPTDRRQSYPEKITVQGSAKRHRAAMVE